MRSMAAKRPWLEGPIRGKELERWAHELGPGAWVHKQYNLRGSRIVGIYLSQTQVDPTKLSGKSAHKWVAGLIRAIEQSGDPFIEGYLQMVRSGKSL